MYALLSQYVPLDTSRECVCVWVGCVGGGEGGLKVQFSAAMYLLRGRPGDMTKATSWPPAADVCAYKWRPSDGMGWQGNYLYCSWAPPPQSHVRDY
jgi:hypothetical protein